MEKQYFPYWFLTFIAQKWPKNQEKAPKSYDFDAFLWWARRDLNPHVRSEH